VRDLSSNPDLVLLLTLSAARLKEKEAWPSLAELELEMVRSRTGADLAKAAREAPRALGRLDEDGVFRPTVLGLSLVPENLRVLRHFMDALTLAREYYEEKAPDATLRRLKKDLHLSMRATRVLANVLEAEDGIFTRVDQARTSTRLYRRSRLRVIPEIWRYANVGSLEDYLAVQAEHPRITEGPPTATEAPALPRSHYRPFGTWAREASASTIGCVVGTVLLAWFVIRPSTTDTPTRDGTSPLSSGCLTESEEVAHQGLRRGSQHIQFSLERSSRCKTEWGALTGRLPHGATITSMVVIRRSDGRREAVPLENPSGWRTPMLGNTRTCVRAEVYVRWDHSPMHAKTSCR
jgi:hypothetical protein